MNILYVLVLIFFTGDVVVLSAPVEREDCVRELVMSPRTPAGSKLACVPTKPIYAKA